MRHTRGGRRGAGRAVPEEAPEGEFDGVFLRFQGQTIVSGVLSYRYTLLYLWYLAHLDGLTRTHLKVWRFVDMRSRILDGLDGLFIHLRNLYTNFRNYTRLLPQESHCLLSKP